ncbi:hypothetical protein EV426DRAFT_712768 [Tirmania nivea]|nr:hypothetical protein EV426DRAFT_712768 [Tirmania nivea]
MILPKLPAQQLSSWQAHLDPEKRHGSVDIEGRGVSTLEVGQCQHRRKGGGDIGGMGVLSSEQYRYQRHGTVDVEGMARSMSEAWHCRCQRYGSVAFKGMETLFLLPGSYR